MAAKANLTVDQGSSWNEELLWEDSTGTPIDTSGMQARMQVRKTIAAATPIVELTTEDGNIELGLTGPIDGQYNIRLKLSAVETAALPASASSKNWYYDLEIVNGPYVTRLLQGRFKVDLEVTR